MFTEIILLLNNVVSADVNMLVTYLGLPICQTKPENSRNLNAS